MVCSMLGIMQVFFLVLALLVVEIQSYHHEAEVHRKMHPSTFPTSTRTSKNPDEVTAEYWITKAQNTIKEKISKPLNQNVAKNVIMFMGDGMSIATLAAARVYVEGEETELSFEKFPYMGLSKTYSIDRQVSDSAVTATAYLGGVKGNAGTIGVNGHVPVIDCLAQANETNHVFSIAYFSQLIGKKTGVVTTSRVTHASPAGVYAHSAFRIWESDTDVTITLQDPSICPDIARQLVYGETGKNLDVVMGGGRQKFLPMGYIDPENEEGGRLDGVNLIDAWVADRPNSQYIWNREQLINLDPEVDKVLGLFASDHCPYNIGRNETTKPSLEEMTAAAIEILSKGENGYFLFVEGARIDMAHHNNQARKALDETAELSKAVQKAVDLTDESDTLIVVTSDHAHTMSYSGYAERGNDIFEFGGIADDGLVYTTINYANGPGYDWKEEGSRHDISQDDLTDPNYHFPSNAPLNSETHGGEDVGIFARGPWAHLFSGVLEQNVIPHLMMYASCTGNGVTACD